jgi:hypothetical protein
VVEHPTRRVARLVGVYNADGGLAGELRYAIGKAFGRTHCALCDLTHRGVRQRQDWRDLCEGLPVPVDLVHLNERSGAVREASRGGTPCLLAEVDDELVLLIGPQALQSCGADVDKLEQQLRLAAGEHNLALA